MHNEASLRARVAYWLLNSRLLPWNWVWVGRWARKHDKEEQG